MATDGKYPRFAIFENVTGAFSSNRGEDFRIVLEEFVKIAEPEATMPPMQGGKWPYADCYVGDGWSIAYRTFDTQYWPRTPQRRRRLYLVADFGGECACKILFEREGLRRDPAQGQKPWQGAPAYTGRSTCANDRDGDYLVTQCSASENNLSSTVCASYGTKWNGNSGAYNGENFVLETRVPLERVTGKSPIAAWQYLFESHAQDARYKGPLDVCPVISAKYGTGGLNQPFVVKKGEGVSVAGFKAGQSAKSYGIGWEEECSPTLIAGNSGTNRAPAVCIQKREEASVYDAGGNEDRKTVSTLTGDHENRITDYTSVIVQHMAFAQNTRNEVRDLKGRAGALAASPGMKQQTYILQKLVLDDQGGQQISVRTDGKAPTIRAEMHGNVPCVVQTAMINSDLQADGGKEDE